MTGHDAVQAHLQVESTPPFRLLTGVGVGLLDAYRKYAQTARFPHHRSLDVLAVLLGVTGRKRPPDAHPVMMSCTPDQDFVRARQESCRFAIASISGPGWRFPGQVGVRTGGLSEVLVAAEARLTNLTYTRISFFPWPMRGGMVE